MTHQAQHILRIDSSIRRSESTTRALTSELIEQLSPARTTVRDLADTLPLIDEAWVGANYTPAENRTEEQKQLLALSDALIEEIRAADTVVIGVPAYNFSIPAGLKAWIDLIARVGVTFRYTEAGPEGLLKGKKVYLVYAAGGTQAGSDIDFATSYMKQALWFVGMDDVTLISADQLSIDAEKSLSSARAQIQAIAA